MVDRASREKVATYGKPSVKAGNIRCCSPPLPVGGNHPRLAEKISINISPRKKPGYAQNCNGGQRTIKEASGLQSGRNTEGNANDDGKQHSGSGQFNRGGKSSGYTFEHGRECLE